MRRAGLFITRALPPAHYVDTVMCYTFCYTFLLTKKHSHIKVNTVIRTNSSKSLIPFFFFFPYGFWHCLIFPALFPFPLHLLPSFCRSTYAIFINLLACLPIGASLFRSCTLIFSLSCDISIGVYLLFHFSSASALILMSVMFLTRQS